MSKYKLSWKDLTWNDFKIYLFALFKAFIPKKKIRNLDDLEKFIQTKSAWVTQVTLYGYLKTRIGVKYTAMVEDEVFSKSINIAKWNIYMIAIADCAFYTFSYLISEKNLKENDCKEIYLDIIEKEKENGLNDEIYFKAKEEFLNRYEKINFSKYYLDNPFKESCLALYNWAPIADELKTLDKEIVLNSMRLKWNLKTDEFKKLTKNLNFN